MVCYEKKICKSELSVNLQVNKEREGVNGVHLRQIRECLNELSN